MRPFNAIVRVGSASTSQTAWASSGRLHAHRNLPSLGRRCLARRSIVEEALLREGDLGPSTAAGERDIDEREAGLIDERRHDPIDRLAGRAAIAFQKSSDFTLP